MSRSVTLHPIGIVRSPFDERHAAPSQPELTGGVEGEIVLDPGMNFEQALEDLDGFDLIWVLFLFDRNEGWRPKVRPPRDLQRRGLFATRSPHRPNPVGLSLLRLLEIRGRRLRVSGLDLLDGTPVLDIKPYLPVIEAHPEARAGWTETVPPTQPRFEVIWSARAREAVEWLLREEGIDLFAPSERLLACTPEPHPYRRVRRLDDGRHELAITSWRVRYRVEGEAVFVEEIASGYSAEALESRQGELHQGEAHRRFHTRYPSE